MGNSQKVFIISLDGATFDVLVPLMEQGYLPNLKRMRDEGLSAQLESVIPPVTAPAWTSFMTGKIPSKHGIYDFTRFNSSSNTWSINSARDIRSKTIWQILSEKGKRVIVLNLPYTYPPYEINGLMVSGWDAPLTESSFSYPDDLSAQIMARFPDYKTNQWVSEIKPRESDEQFQEFTTKIVRGFEQQTQIALDLLGKEYWDVFMVHFQQTDWIQHKLWSYIEQGCRNPGDRNNKVEATRNCYRRFDELVGTLLQKVEPSGAIQIALSDHGFQRFRGTIYPNFYLKQWGYLTTTTADPVDRLKPVRDLLRKSRYAVVRKAYRSFSHLMQSLSNGHAGRQFESWTDNTNAQLSGRGRSLDWNKSKVVTVYAYQMGFLYVNLVGRGPAGMVEPGAAYETIIADLTARFRDLRHPHTGEKLLLDVLRGHEAFPASQDDIPVPDLVLVPVDGYGFGFTIADEVPEISEEGLHQHNGVLLMRGAALKKPLNNFQCNLTDIAPTVLHLLDLPVPMDMDGRVLHEVLADERPIQWEEVNNSMVQEEADYTTQESELIEQRLRGLGYLE